MSEKFQGWRCMKKSKEQRHVPALRFPEFRGSGEWLVVKIGSILKESSVASAVNNPKKRITVKLNLNGVVKRDYRGTESLGATKHFIRNSGDFIYGKQNIHKGAFGLIPENLDGFETSKDLPCFKFYSQVNSKWFFYSLSRENVYRNLEHKMTGTGSKRLKEDKFLNIDFLKPDFEEQQKIANCLSSLDDLITAESKQLTALKTHKTGLMQQLFPNEGETTPKLRFPEFQNDGAWEKSTIGDISFISSGGTPNRQNQSYWGGDIPWITTTLIDFNYIDKAIEYITQKGLENSSARKIKENTILMAMYGQGKTRGKVAILSITAATNQACAAIQVKSNHNVNFVFQNLMSRYEEIRKISNEGGQKNLSATIIKTIPFKYPPKEEQQKIADCLSSLDTLITAQTKKIEQLKQHKKGLMQQLFPTLDGVGA